MIGVDNEPVAALAATALAVSCAREGRKVLLADLCPGRPAARLLGARNPGVHEVTVDGVTLTVVDPGPRRRRAGRAAPGRASASTPTRRWPPPGTGPTCW